MSDLPWCDARGALLILLQPPKARWDEMPFVPSLAKFGTAIRAYVGADVS